MFAIQEPLRNRPKCRVELHIHLDGAIRTETIWEIMRKKGMPLPGDGSLATLRDSFITKEPSDLSTFIRPISAYLPIFQCDLESIERFSFEFVEDEALQSVAYCEARFCPHLFVASRPTAAMNGDADEGPPPASDDSFTVRTILNAVLRGLKRGEERFGTKVRLILCCIRGKTEWSREILSLCDEFRNDGVVGIDIVGNPVEETNEKDNKEEISIFEAAKKKGIHRTVHAGEDGGWQAIEQAIHVLGAERIGHGYCVLENEEFYNECLQARTHFEVCPHSSYLTGAINKMNLQSKRHPILRFAEDNASFSISSDDPVLTGTQLSDEYDLLHRWGFTEAQFAKANFEAALKSFLPTNEKLELLASLREAYGVVDNTSVVDIASVVDSAVAVKNDVQHSALSFSEVKKPSVKIATWGDRKF